MNMQTDLLANGRETASLATLVDGLGDPVDPGVTADLHNIEEKLLLCRGTVLTALWLGSTQMTS